MKLMHRWLNPKAAPFLSSVHGIGLKAMQPIKKGEVVQVIGGEVLSRSDMKEFRKTIGHIGIQIHDDFWLVPRSRKEIEEYGAPNHSCDPNLGFEGSNIYVAIRDIAKGEEIVIDYAFMESDFQPFDCRCGSKNCRKLITKDDWRSAQLQKKHGQYFSDYLKRKFEK